MMLLPNILDGILNKFKIEQEEGGEFSTNHPCLHFLSWGMLLFLHLIRT
jgi:hypothetical protein